MAISYIYFSFYCVAQLSTGKVDRWCSPRYTNFVYLIHFTVTPVSHRYVCTQYDIRVEPTRLSGYNFVYLWYLWYIFVYLWYHTCVCTVYLCWTIDYSSIL